MEFATFPYYIHRMGLADYHIEIKAEAAGIVSLQLPLSEAAGTVGSQGATLLSWSGVLLIAAAILAVLWAAVPYRISARRAKLFALFCALTMLIAGIEEFTDAYVSTQEADFSLASRYAAVVLAAVVVVAAIPWLVMESVRAQRVIRGLQKEVTSGRKTIEEILQAQTLLAHSVSEAGVALRSAGEREHRLASLVESSKEAIVGLNSDGTIWHLNPAAEALFAFKAQELIGASAATLQCSPSGNLWKEVEQLMRQPFFGGQSEVLVVRGDGAVVPIWLSVSEIGEDGNSFKGFALTARDMTEKRQVDERIARSLQEKVILLKEVHHRVKNNLQLICSLLRLQSKEMTDEVGLRIFRKSEERIRSLALVHERLYSSDNVSCIRFDEYLQDLINQVTRSAARERSGLHITTETSLARLPLAVDTSISFGLMANELLTNAIRHAAPKGNELAISVILRRSADSVIFSVFDNGFCEKGLPMRGGADRLGLTLVRMLARQLNGDLSFEYCDGTRCTVTIPLTSAVLGYNSDVSCAA